MQDLHSAVVFEMKQRAPWPDILSTLVEGLTYKPGWHVWLEDTDRGQESVGLTLIIHSATPDSDRPERTTEVIHYLPVPPAAYNRRSWQRWLFEQFLLVERHEAMEFFKIDGERPYAPAHGSGNDPYLVLEYGTEEDATTTFRGERVVD